MKKEAKEVQIYERVDEISRGSPEVSLHTSVSF
jgi:hypothetical protein